MSGVDVIMEDLKSHPWCPHGPTLLFSRQHNGFKRKFYACSACRDRKLCAFFLYEDDRNKHKTEIWDQEREKLVKDIDHKNLFLRMNQVKQVPSHERGYCRTCSSFQLKEFWSKHKDHDLVINVTDRQIEHPSEFLPPLEDAKKEAQFLFSRSSVEVIITILKKLKYKKVICMGTPRLHEVLVNKCPKMETLLLDFDARYHSFYSPLQFCWYNCFNNHFFLPKSEEIFLDFVQNSSDLVLVMDPPFGGRVEPLAHTLHKIREKCNNSHLPVFWMFPYFMEPQILNGLPQFAMLDYKVDYENHPLFRDGATARKFGSPVRIFTNVDPSKIELPIEDGYKFCEDCKRWVSAENKHCPSCDSCTSKDGRTYVHCAKCERCVKPSWQHCEKCDRCCQPQHQCGEFKFMKNCFHCKKPGHKKRDCPKVDCKELQQKRKLKFEEKLKKKIKII